MGNPGSETIVRLAHVNYVICIIVHLKKAIKLKYLTLEIP